MNTSGIQRGYMAKNMKAEEFIKVVVNALSKEFGKEVKLEIINDNEFRITLDNYKIKMNKELIEKHKTPYGVDRFILELLKKQGFKFDTNRSQYIKYCFGIY
ncbi:hypothetical protein [Clostridium sp. JNZ J1-5]